MKKFIILLPFLFHILAIAQQNEIRLSTNYGSKNKEIHDILRFQEIETTKLTFSGKQLKGKDYIFLVKEFTNGRLAKTDTLLNSKSSKYIKKVEKEKFSLKYFVKTENKTSVKMSFIFPRFSITRKYDIKKPKDEYALHDFLGNKKGLIIPKGKPSYVLGYFLPYLHKKSGFKSYCDVSSSKFKPEDWGKKLGIPNYFLIQIMFH